MNLATNDSQPTMDHALLVMSEAFANLVAAKAIRLIEESKDLAVAEIAAARGEEEKWDVAACASFFGYSVNWVRTEILNRPDFPAHCGISAHKKRWRASDVKSWHRKNLAYMQSLRGAKKKRLAATDTSNDVSYEIPSSLTKKGGRPRKVK
jgi:hypothetical protein